MSPLRGLMVLMALLPGTWMTFDGVRALAVGDYVTPRSGPFVGRLGPWAAVVQAVGIAPRSAAMKILFVMTGLLWLIAALGIATHQPWGGRLLLMIALGTLWYLPVGTAVSVLELIGLVILRNRT